MRPLQPCTAAAVAKIAHAGAGQAVIQFAADKETREEYAIKVFLSRRAFEDEAALYEDKSNPLGQFLPQVRDIVDNRDGRFTDASGHAMPPCIVMEKGESLDMWMLRSTNVGVDMVTGLQVCPPPASPCTPSPPSSTT